MTAQTPLIARRCFVSGRVQGVFFRGATRQQALASGVQGFARNLRDGRVEVLAIGDAEAVQRLIDWLWRGPPSAHVTNVVVEEVEQPEAAPSGFATY